MIPTPADKPSAALRAVAGLLPFVVTSLVCLVAAMVAGPRDAVQAARESGVAVGLVALAALVAVVAAGVAVAFAPGARVPAAIPIALGTWPWLAGLASTSWNAARVESAIAFAEPAVRATLIAQGLAEALLGRVIGGVVGAGTLAGIALAMATAAAAPRAPNRSGLGAMGGLVAGGVPVLAGIAFATLGGGASGAALLTGVGAIGATACAVAGWGAGADQPHARAASLAAATPVAALLAVLCAGGAASNLPLIEVLRAIAVADAASRVELLATYGDEIEVPSALAAHAWGLGLLGCAALSGWAASRARPTRGRLAGAAAVIAIPIATNLLGRGAEGTTSRLLADRQEAPWDALEGFEPVLARRMGTARPALLFGVDRVVASDGRSVPVAGIESPGAARDAVARWSATRSRAPSPARPRARSWRPAASSRASRSRSTRG